MVLTCGRAQASRDYLCWPHPTPPALSSPKFLGANVNTLVGLSKRMANYTFSVSDFGSGFLSTVTTIDSREEFK
jgi:hypothetical protein